ncbi:MAG: 30S ribosomal protein S3 [Candidatus Diapherotrites archaeon]|nr:30S ribosomal protein S3 [Candidatus Diapherotrites archaeon]
MTGQKTSLNSWHVGNNLKWLLIQEHLEKAFRKAGFAELVINRTPMGTIITVKANYPGMAIGKNGNVIRKVTQELIAKFDFENELHLEVEPFNTLERSARVMAELAVTRIERGYYGPKTIGRIAHQIMDYENYAEGCKIILSGKWRFGNRAKTLKKVRGRIFHSGNPAKEFVDKYIAVGKRKNGTFSVTVMILEKSVNGGTKIPPFKLVDEPEVENPLW